MTCSVGPMLVSVSCCSLLVLRDAMLLLGRVLVARHLKKQAVTSLA